MKTSAISTPAVIPSGTASTTKPSDALPEAPFSQLLSHEMATRTAPAEAEKPSSAQGNKEAQAPRTDSKTDRAESKQESDASATRTSDAGATTTDKPAKADTADAVKAKTAKASDSEQEDESTVSAASAELLALVASLTQPASKAPTETDAKDESVKAADSASDDAARSTGKAQDFPVQVDTAIQDTTVAEQASALLQGVTVAGRTNPQLRATSTEADTPPVVTGGRRAGRLSAEAATRAAAAQRSNDRAESPTVTNEIATEPTEFDAKLAQAKGEKAASADDPGKRSLAPDQMSATQSAAETSAAKPMQESQHPAAIPFNINALTATQTQSVQAAPTHMADMLAPRVGSQDWNQALGQKIVWMVGSEQQSASLTLNPPDLGPLQVVLHVSENQATANFTAAQPEVRHALEAAMPRLREMLGDAGIQLSQANVSAGTPNHQQNAFDQQQRAPRQGTADAKNDGGEAAPTRVVRSQTISGGQGLVDTFV